jgi:RNA polymerase sigma-70 factor (ECF subfamily)
MRRRKTGGNVRLVQRAENWRCSSLSHRLQQTQVPWLSAWPMTLPGHWTEYAYKLTDLFSWTIGPPSSRWPGIVTIMYTTSASLLEQLRQPGADDAWARLVELYTPLLYYWARRLGLKSDDAGDLVQDVFTVLVQKLPEFRYDGQQSFRGWLRTVALNKWRDGQRRRPRKLVLSDPQTLSQLPDSLESDPFWETEYREQLVAQALALMESEFRPETWRACWETTVAGRPAAEIAAELGTSVNAIYAAKSRVLRRLRQELDGLLD